MSVRTLMLGIVTGLTDEARLARPLGLARAGGGLPAGAAAAAEWLIGQGVEALLSFGVAGGLDPALRPGDIVIPAEVREGDRLYATDAALAVRFGTPSGLLLAGDGVAVTAADKARLFEATGAMAIDLESGAVARLAARAGIPFAVLRAVCDPAERTLPPAALAAIDERGHFAAGRLLASLARHPGQLPALIALAGDARAARAALRKRIAG